MKKRAQHALVMEFIQLARCMYSLDEAHRAMGKAARLDDIKRARGIALRAAQLRTKLAKLCEELGHLYGEMYGEIEGLS